MLKKNSLHKVVLNRLLLHLHGLTLGESWHGVQNPHVPPRSSPATLRLGFVWQSVPAPALLAEITNYGSVGL